MTQLGSTARAASRAALRDQTEPLGDKPFDWHRQPGSSRARRLVQEAMSDANAVRMSAKGARKRSQRHQEVFEGQVGAIIANAAVNALTGFSGGVHVTRSKRCLEARWRGKPGLMTGAFPDRLDELHASGWIVQDGARPGRRARRRTVVRPGPRLLERLRQAPLTPSGFAQTPGAEALVVKGPDKQPMPLPSNEHASALKADMDLINRHISSLRIDALDTDQDTGRRRLHRSFINGSFHEGGRLWGGFWQGMSKQDRFDKLRLDGERVAELDFPHLHPRILYALAGERPPSGDLYAIPGLEGATREGIKKVVSAMLWQSAPMVRLPRGTRSHFPAEHTGRTVAKAIRDHHHLIAEYLEAGHGGRVMGVESAIMVEALKEAARTGLPALPIHDALLVPVSRISEGRALMENAFLGLTGHRIDVVTRCPKELH